MTVTLKTSDTLNGYSALVTGGGTGLGRACAAQLAADGAAVTICGRTEATLENAIALIKEAAGTQAKVHFVVGDVTVEEDVKNIVKEAVQLTGSLNACVANAGGGGMLGTYENQDTDEFLRVLNLNVLGTMLCVKHCVPHMLKAGGGSFVGMSSLAGHVTHRFFGAYCVSKAGIEEMMRNAADEFGQQGVRFNAIRPGFIATEIMEMIPRDSRIFASYVDNTPMGGIGEPQDVGNLARFLIGPESRWITGQIISVDGGNGLRRGPDYTEYV